MSINRYIYIYIEISINDFDNLLSHYFTLLIVVKRRCSKLGVCYTYHAQRCKENGKGKRKSKEKREKETDKGKSKGTGN